MNVMVLGDQRGRRQGKNLRHAQARTSLYLHGVNLSQISFVTLREKPTRMELSYSRFSRHLIAWGNGLFNFSSLLTLPFSGCE